MGLKLKLKRIEKGFKQGELAEIVGISRYYLSALENDRANSPSIKIMKRISEVLETPVQELFFEN